MLQQSAVCCDIYQHFTYELSLYAELVARLVICEVTCLPSWSVLVGHHDS